MNKFLKESRKLLSLSENLCIVLGNESCDLDSAVSSISLAYYYNQHRESLPTRCKDSKGVLALLNIPKRDYPIKTEVTHFLQKNDIDETSLIFKDEIDESVLRRCNLVLVDHHVSPYHDAVVATFDHRPFEANSKLREDSVNKIEQVGSCSTLIANLILETKTPEDYVLPLRLLYGAIVLDTINFSAQAGRFNELDIEIVERIEKILNIENASEKRQSLFDELVEARADVSQLTAYQLLHKDMKKISNKDGCIQIPIPGIGRLKDFIALPDAKESIARFADEHNASVIVLIGMKANSEKVERDVGVINIKNPKLFSEIISNLQTSPNVDLGLVEYENYDFLDGKFFSQSNIKATRKHILPIIKGILDKL